MIDRFQNETPCRVLVFTSPKAGSGASREQIPQLLRLLEDAATQGSVAHRVTHTVEELQRQLASTGPSGTGDPEETVVVAAGGDGTLSLAASALSSDGAAGDVPIVPMPLGTENLLARQFGHTAKAECVLRTIRCGTSYRLDAGMANDQMFLIMATCGFDAEVVRGMHLTRRGHISRLSYMRPIVRAICGYEFPPITIRIDEGDSIECCWAMVFNLPRYGGGLKIEPDAIGDDGLFDVIAFTRGSILSGLKYAAGIWLGRHRTFGDVIRRRGRTVEITSDGRVPFQLDGDYAGRLPLRIKMKPSQVHLLLPP